MKKVLLSFGLFLVSCTPATQIITALAPKPPSQIGAGRIVVTQGQKGCSGDVSYDLDGRIKYVRVGDKTEFKFTNTPEGVTIRPEINGEDIRFCAITTLKAIPEEAQVNVQGSVNGVVVDGSFPLTMLPESLIDFPIDSNSKEAVAIGGKLCSSIGYRANNSLDYTAVKASDITLTFSSKAKINVTIEQSENPLCFSVPSDGLAGTYEVVARGIVAGVGVNKTIRVLVR